VASLSPAAGPSSPRAVVGLFVACMLVMLGFGIVSPLLGVFATGLGAGGTMLGILYGAFSLSRATFMPLLGRLSDRVDKRWLIMLGLLLVCLLAVLYTRTTTLPQLLAVRFLHGISSAMVIPIAMARVAELAPPAREGEMMGTFAISITLGMAAGPALGGLMYERGGFDLAFMSLCGLGLAGLLVVAIVVPRTAAHQRRQSSLRTLALDPVVATLAGCRFLTASAIATLIGFLPIHAARTGIGVGQAGLVITTSLVVSALLQRWAGILADRMPRIALLVTGIVLLGTMLSLVPGAGTAGLLGLAVAIGLARATTVSAGGALIASLGREHGAGSVMGVVNTAMAVGFGVGPLIAGVCMDRWGLALVFPIVGLGVVGGALVAGGVLWARLARRRSG
jgi:MFS family permease